MSSSVQKKVRSQLWWLLYLTPLVGIGPISTDLYLPALPEISHKLSTPVSQVQLTLSTFMVGFALSQLITGPLSDRYGRRPVILGGMLLYFVSSLVCVYAPNLEILITARLFQAFGACAGSVLGRAIIRDVYEPKESIKMMAVMGMTMAVAPAIAPIIGSWLLEFFGWRSTFVAMAVFAVGLLGATVFLYEETNLYIGENGISPKAIGRNFWILCQNQTFIGYGAVMALMTGGLFSFISGGAVVLINDMGLTPKTYGYAFTIMVSGLAIGSWCVGKLSQIYKAKNIVGVGVGLCIFASAVNCTLSWSEHQTAMSLLCVNAFFAIGFSMLMPTCMTASIGPFPRLAGSAASFIGFWQGACAASAGWMVGLLYDHSSRGLTSSILIYAVLAGIFYVMIARPATDGVIER